MTRTRGFALLAALWMVAAVGGIVAATFAALRVGEGATRNRVMLARGRWAAEACLAIAAARYAQGRLADTATVDLGRATSCAWRLEDPTARLNVNLVDRGVLQRFLESAGVPAESAAAIAEALAARRAASPLPSVDEATAVGGCPVSLQPYLTVDGPGTVNASSAPAEVLRALPGIAGEAVELLVRRRMEGRPLAGLDALASALSPAAQASMLADYADLARVLVFAAPQLLLTSEGWVDRRGDTPLAAIELLLVPLPGRLAVIRRRMT